MNITIKDSEGGRRLSSLEEGDCFVRNAKKRPIPGRTVYMVLHYHTRLEDFRSPEESIVVVNLGTARISSMMPRQHILQVNGGVEMEVVE